MRLSTDSLLRRVRLAATLVVVLVTFVVESCPSALGVTLTWDASGAGTVCRRRRHMETAAANWWDGNVGDSDIAWPTNATTYTAVFGAGSGAAGTVTVGGAVTANAITFNPTGSGAYTLNGGTITLGGTTPTITMNAASGTRPSTRCWPARAASP